MITVVRAIALLIVALLLAPAPADAQTAKKKTTTPSAAKCTNGCGPDGWMGDLIPNGAAGCKFKAACDKHDICYGRCDGTNCPQRLSQRDCQGKCASCDKSCPPARKLRREGCDKALEANIINDNNGSCRVAAYAYRIAVSSLGCIYFNGFGAETAEERKQRLKRTFRRSFETAFERARANPEVMREGKVEQETAALRAVGEVADVTDQPLKLDRSQTPPGLAFQGNAARFAPPPERVLLNGVDVTDVMVRGNTFDLDKLRRERSNFDATGLTQEKVDQ